MIDNEKDDGCVVALLVSSLIDAVALHGIVRLIAGIGRRLGWWA